MRAATVAVLLLCVAVVVTSSPTAPPSNCHRWCRRPHAPKEHCCVRPGKCPPKREEGSCVLGAASSDEFGYSLCDDDGDCALTDKCCEDTCIKKKVCKTKYE